MATATLTKAAAKGGSFLLESPQRATFSRLADLSDDQRFIGQTAKNLFLKEVFRAHQRSRNKKAGLDGLGW